MPSNKESESLRRTLEERLATLRALIDKESAAESRERGSDHAVEVGDVMDDAVGASMLRTEEALTDMHRAEAQHVEEALKRLDAGTYGRCVDCDDDIEPARLTAYPASKRCGACQRRHEQATPSR